MYEVTIYSIDSNHTTSVTSVPFTWDEAIGLIEVIYDYCENVIGFSIEQV